MLSLDSGAKQDPRFVTSSFMSDSDRQVYFADFVIELQAAEDDKRRRIRDARRRAEKAQREAFRDFLKRLAYKGTILPYTRWRNVEGVISGDESFRMVLAQDRESPRELFEEFTEEWDETYRRERAFLGRLVGPQSKKGRLLKPGTNFDEYTKVLLDEAAYSPEVYGDTRHIINRQEPISSARLFYDELMVHVNENSRRLSHRHSMAESSEDEGEIIEDGEVEEGPGLQTGSSSPPVRPDVETVATTEGDKTNKIEEVAATDESPNAPVETAKFTEICGGTEVKDDGNSSSGQDLKEECTDKTPPSQILANTDENANNGAENSTAVQVEDTTE